jgi:cell division protein FtsW (lipid II flippase)
MRIIGKNKGVIQALFFTVMTLFVSYFIVTLSDDDTMPDESMLWIMKTIIIVFMVLLTAIGWGVAFSENE